jgi:hypothetical protein
VIFGKGVVREHNVGEGGGLFILSAMVSGFRVRLWDGISAGRDEVCEFTRDIGGK